MAASVTGLEVRQRPSVAPPRRCEAGNAAVEFALIAPVLLLIVLGTLVFGLYFGVAHSIQQLASEAARASVAGITESERTSLARSFVERSVAAYALLRPEALTITAGFDAADTERFTVSLRYDATGLGLNLFSGILPMLPEIVERRATIRRGGF